jgi:hypothetical protein
MLRCLFSVSFVYLILKHFMSVAIFTQFSEAICSRCNGGRHFPCFMRGETKHRMLLAVISPRAVRAPAQSPSAQRWKRMLARVARSRQKHLAPITGVKHTPINYKNENGGAQEIPGVLREKAA